MKMKKTYLSPRTRFIDLSTESPLLDISMPKTDEEAGYDDVLTRHDEGIWNNWSEDDK